MFADANLSALQDVATLPSQAGDGLIWIKLRSDRSPHLDPDQSPRPGG